MTWVTWVMVCGCVIGSWAVLSILGSERQRRVEKIERDARLQAEQQKKQQDETALAGEAPRRG